MDFGVLALIVLAGLAGPLLGAWGNVFVPVVIGEILAGVVVGEGGLPAIREKVTPHTLRYTCIASLFAAGADQEYVAEQVGHEDVSTTNRIYRYVLQRRRRGEIGRRRQLAMRESVSEIGRAVLLPDQAGGVEVLAMRVDTDSEAGASCLGHV